MDLAERLHMTLAQLLEHADSRELGLWLARDIAKAKEHKSEALMALAERARQAR